MGSKHEPSLLRQKAYFEFLLDNRRAFLSENGVEPGKAAKDALVRKVKAQIKALNYRLRRIAEIEKKKSDMAKFREERKAAPRREKKQDGDKAGKNKKAPQEPKAKALKAEKSGT
ncbi:MAG: hypothetical protein JW747_03940 [Candidatus Aminicenantes bacterium]|nr:hypothetical protein [Candidatus Aminicenantes bacterium]